MRPGALARRTAGLIALASSLAACGPSVDTPPGPAAATVTPQAASTAAASTAAQPSLAIPTVESARATASPTGAASAPNTTPAAASPAPASSSAQLPTPPSGSGGTPAGLDCIAPVLKRHPIDLAPYDAASGRAGDASFVRPLLFNRVFTEFGFVIPAANTSTGNDKPNPQPTYLAPMGTKVRSAVDGVIDRIADLWSTPTLGDVSVMVKPDGLAGRCYMVVEFEHVVNPVVRMGDRVTAGQVIAEVGPLNSQGSQGLGLVEFGILTGAGDGRPLHVCPYAYFDPVVRGAQLAILGRFLADWETFAGDASLYNEGAWAGGVTGCRSGPIKE